MPLLSRVLHPASKRKPAFHSQGMVSPSIPRSDRPDQQCLVQVRFDSQGAAANIRRPARKSSSYLHNRNPTFSELYPIFRSILEKRHLTTHRLSQHTPRRAVISLSGNSGRAPSVTTPLDSLHHNQLEQIISTWESPAQISSRRVYLAGRSRSVTIPANFQSPLYSPRRTTTVESSVRSSPSSHRLIPFRSISHQSSTRLFEDIISISTPGIQDDYLSIIETPPPTPRPSSPGVIKEWIVSQLAVAREYFKRQNYMQALGIIEKVRAHDYVSMLTTFPKYSASARQSRWHLQDLALVEYCCNLAYVHESQIGNVDIVDTVNQLNSTILAPVGDFQETAALGFKTSFLKQNDPLVDHTLAILIRNWADPWNDAGMLQMSDNGVAVSTEQIALATAIRPFLQAITARQLFPSSTSLLLNSTAMPVPDSPRRMVLEAFLMIGNDRCAMDWIKLWSRRDRSDWLQYWSNFDFKQSVARSHVSSVDCIIDVARMSHDSKGNWLQDLATTLAAAQTEVLESPTLSLTHLFELMNLDSSSFHHKTRFYKDLKLGRKDLMESWIIGARAFDLSKAQVRNQAEHDLWNEMTMIGVFAKDLMLDDVLRSIKQLPSRAERERQQDVHAVGSRIDSDLYSDSLTLYLESIASSSNFGSAATIPWLSGVDVRQDQSKSRAPAILAKAIQNLMSREALEDREFRMTKYRNLLLDVAQSVAVRLGHRGLLSQVSESKFLGLHGRESWTASVVRSATNQDTKLSRNSIDLEDSTYRGNAINFAEGSLTSDLSKWCAASVAISGSSKIKWEGRFSEWFMNIAGSSPRSGPMARALQFQGRLDPASGPYQIALWALIKDKEYDLAAELHSSAYRLFEARNPTLDVLDTELVARPRPTVKEVGMLVSALAKSDRDPKHLLQAQSILDRHLDIECRSADAEPHPLVDIQTMTELAGAWSRRANYVQLRHVLETMRHLEIQPNMVFYNTLLKSLVDLAPLLRDGARTFGGGSDSNTRELGRDLMVRQLLRSQDSAPRSDSGIDNVRSELQEGWEIFQSLVSRRSDRSLRLPTLSGQGMDSPTALKSLVLDPELTQGSSFSPDAFTFSILLGAFARRGEIEPISDLFVEMKELGIEPDEFICTILANAFVKRGDLRSVDRVLQEARSRRMEPGLPLSNMILNSLVEMNAPVASIRDALDRMIAKFGSHDSMDSDQEVEIPVRRQDLLNSRFHPSRSNAQDRAGTTSTRSRGNSNSTLDAVTMTTLIKYHARQDDLQSAQDIFETMVQAGLVPGQRVYVHLIAACIRKRDVELGVSVLRTMRSESGLQADAKAWKGLFRCALDLESHLVDGTRLCRPSLGHSNQSGSRKRSQPVSVVLQEFSTVIEELMRSSENDAKAKDGKNVAHSYLWKVLTSSWITLKDIDDPSMPLSRKRNPILNSEVKGKNSLLRRLLDHLLRDTEVKSKASTDRTKGVLTSPSIPRPRKHKGSLISEVDERQFFEAGQDLEKRCEQAIRLVRLVEATGIELGPQWKRDVVIRRVQSLTGEDSASILKRLQRRDRLKESL